jgi:hypothetical protein
MTRLRAEHALASVLPPEPASARDDLPIVAHPMGSGARVLGSGGETDLSEGGSLGPGSRVITPATGRASLSFSSGTTVALGEGSDMTVVSQGANDRLRLDKGAIDLHVAKQEPSHRFLVDTLDAEVEVRGTKFRVSLVAPDRGCGDGTLTRVVVTEGVVVVRTRDSETRIAAGERWPVGCAHEPAANFATASQPQQLTGASRFTSTGAVCSSNAGSSLTDQNDLFAEALAAKRQGDVWGAVGVFERLCSRFPASPLAESAAVERMRLLRDASPSKARAAAQQYLVRYPNGYAHAEADAIVTMLP